MFQYLEYWYRYWYILVSHYLPEFYSICNTRRYWSLPNMSIADIGKLWKILVIPVLQILEDSGKYWLYKYCRYWQNRYEVADCTCILFFFVLSVCLL
jgi:hypothetical protein